MAKKEQDKTDAAPLPTLMPPPSFGGARLWAALLAVRDLADAAATVPADSTGEDGSVYASAESVIRTARALLRATGLLLLPAVGRVDVCEVIPALKSFVLSRPFLLLHVPSGESYWFSSDWPFAQGSSRTLTDACSATMTASLAYAYRDLLCLPRESGRRKVAPEEQPPADEPIPPDVEAALDARALADDDEQPDLEDAPTTKTLSG